MMSYVGDAPWHRLGTKLPAGATAAEMSRAAHLDWTVSLHQAMFKNSAGEIVPYESKRVLVRDDVGAPLDIVSDEWYPLQNEDAFRILDEIVRRCGAEMDTAGALDGGRTVWGLARLKMEEEIVPGDVIESYALLVNPHRYGHTIRVMSTAVRVVCHNTLTAAISSTGTRNVDLRYRHTKQLDTDGIAAMTEEVIDRFRDFVFKSKLLSTKPARDVEVEQYLQRLFPNRGETERNKALESARRALETQPGAAFGAGTWWQAFNAVTYTVDHVLGRSDTTRFRSAMTGLGAAKKQEALNLALEYAD